MSKTYDFIVIGGGISGVAAAYELSAHGTVALLERENQLAYHTTGRSAAISMESYGNATIRALTVWSTKFLKNCEGEFSDHPVWSPRGALILADETQAGNLDRRIAAIRKIVPDVKKVCEKEILELAPYLRPGHWDSGLYEEHAFDLDVHGIHSGYVRGLKRNGGTILRNTEFARAEKSGRTWQTKLSNGDEISSGVLVNAAGAWADEIAERSGLAKCGIRPLRRTVLLIDPQSEVRHTPYVGTVDEQLFIKPEATGFMVSPCDETLSTPCDAAPEEIDVAITMDRFLTLTSFERSKIQSKWAGLRTFVPDRSPIVGNDPTAPNFVWFAAVGGYGIQAGPAMAKICAALAAGNALPDDIRDAGVSESDLSPGRCQVAHAVTTELNAVEELC